MSELILPPRPDDNNDVWDSFTHWTKIMLLPFFFVFLVTCCVQVCLTSSAGFNVGVKILGYCFKYPFWYLRVWPFYPDNVVSRVQGLIVALQADAGLLRVHLTGEQWHRSRFRVCLWLLELNGMARHPASLTFCPLEPFSKTLVPSQMYNNIFFKNTALSFDHKSAG